MCNPYSVFPNARQVNSAGAPAVHRELLYFRPCRDYGPRIKIWTDLGSHRSVQTILRHLPPGCLQGPAEDPIRYPLILHMRSHKSALRVCGMLDRVGAIFTYFP